ncbi:MAG: ATP-binding protein, partial [Bryobacteraceae bacterium]
MEALLKDLLEYSRVTNAATAGGPDRADANAALKEALLNLAATVEENHARVRTADELPVVKIPLIHLIQLFQNLIGNTIKYRQPEHPAGEPPTVEIAAVRQGRDRWLFSVRDNGIGIDAQYLIQIFGVFKRLHGQSVEGTGIGLALCQKIVERAGGRIWVESKPGVGSTFFFTLPGAGER